MKIPSTAAIHPRLQAAWDAGPPAEPRPRQCGTCAYTGKFANAPGYEKEYHFDWLNDPEYDGAHRCHEEPEVRCAGCTRWTQDAIAISTAVQEGDSNE